MLSLLLLMCKVVFALSNFSRLHVASWELCCCKLKILWLPVNAFLSILVLKELKSLLLMNEKRLWLCLNDFLSILVLKELKRFLLMNDKRFVALLLVNSSVKRIERLLLMNEKRLWLSVNAFLSILVFKEFKRL